MNIVDSDGKVITFLDGRLTLSQLLGVVVGVVLLLIIWKLVKAVLKVVLSLVVCIVICGFFGINCPSDLSGLGDEIKSRGIQYYEKFAESSESINVSNNVIKVKLDDIWVDLKESISVVDGIDGTLTLVVDGVSYKVEDKYLIDLINSFKR